jgi:putative DNA primase/helicase
MVDLRAVRVALLEELPETGGGNPFLNTTALKKMIGTDRIRARRLYQNNVEFDVTHSMFITTNFEDIAVKETDHGSWRRLLRIPFPLQYVNREPSEAHERRADPDLRARLERSPSGQHEAVLAWLVAGAVRWYAGLGDVDYGKMPEPPAPVLESTEAWRASQDVIFQFLKRGVIEFVKDSYVTQDDLHWSFTQALDRTDIGISEFPEKFARHGMIRDQRAVKPSKKRTGSLNISRPTRGDRPLPERTVVWYGIRFSDEFVARGQTEDFFGNVS